MDKNNVTKEVILLNKATKTTMRFKKVLSALKVVSVNYCICSIVCFILLNGKIAAESTQTSQRVVYSIGDCDIYPQNSSEPCEDTDKSFKDVASEVKEKMYNDVQIIVNTIQVHMNGNASFINLTSLNITGIFHLTNIICTTPGAGIMLRDIDSVMLTNLNLRQCGSLFTNTLKKNKTISSALIMIHCSNVQIYNLTIEQSNGTGLMVFNHRGGTVNIRSATFRENELSQIHNNANSSTTSIFGGGGVYILLGKFQSENSMNYLPMTFQFEDCTFEQNTAHNKHFSYLSGESQKDCGEGGGVYLTIDHKRGISNVYTSFVNCSFVENYACVGAGLSLKIHGGKFGQEITNITFNVTDTRFYDNGCYSGYGWINETDNTTEYAHFGGGLYLALSKLNNYDNRSGIENCHIHFSNISFTRNCAKYGGGVYYYSDRSKQIPFDNTVLFDDCCFENNRAHIGSAVDMAPNIFTKLMTGHTIIPTFRNCTFSENYVFAYKERNGQKTFGLGTIRTSLQDVHFEGHNHFEINWGTALYVVNAIANFQKSSATFVNNTGLQGGAIALIESATVILGPNSYEFHNNSAFYQGGAIYVLLIDNFDIAVSRSCFLQYADPYCNHDIDDVDNYTCDELPWKANITFEGNKVIQGKTGHTLYATSLYPCQVVNNNSGLHSDFLVLNISEVFSKRGIEISGDNHIATDGATINVNADTPLMVIPGEKKRHNITVTDDLGQNSNVLFRVKKNCEKFSELADQESDKINISSTFIGDTLQLMGKPTGPNQTSRFNLHTLSSRQIFIEIDVELLDCPPGFKLDDDEKCICNENAAIGIYKCDIKKFQSHLLPGYWVGYLPEESSTNLVTCTCPFCNYSVSTSEYYNIVLPRNKSELNRAVCGDTRTGKVCGKCRENYTVHFHSPGYHCKLITLSDPVNGCKLGWLFYILSELVPVTLVFIIVLVFNISFTSGRVSGLILFSQLLGMFDIDASGIIKFSSTEKRKIDKWAQGYKVLYGVFNLEFFNSETLSFCIMKNASALDMIAFKYITILYALILIASVIWIMNKCGGRCCGKYCRITTVRSSVIHGISSFLVICYTQCVRISMNLLNPVHFNVELGSNSSPPVRVWYNAEIGYFHNQHLPYALPALFCLLTIGILPPALLISYPLLNKVTAFFGCDDLRSIGFISQKLSISNLKPLLDSFQSCFKDNMRFFAGLYFLYRMVILFIYAVTTSYSAYYTAVSGTLLIMLVVHTICQPYVNRTHNIIDALLLADLILISCFSFYNYHRNHYLRGVKHLTTTIAAVLQLILIYLPVIVLGLYILFILCKRVAKCKPIASTEQAIKLREFIRTISNESEDNDLDVDELELTHDQLMDEDVEYNANTCGYFKADSAEMTLNYI